MRKVLFLLAAGCLFAAGCAKTDTPADPGGPPGGGPGGISAPPLGGGETVTPAPIPIGEGEVKITPENSAIGFKGTKADGQHLGGFAKFAGTVKVDKDSKALQGIDVTITTDSIWTDTPKLTTHLKSIDFFDVKQFPEAKFVSKSITAKDADKGEYTVKGDLTLHGVTKEIEFPVTVTVDDKGLRLTSSFQFDRTDFAINYEPARVHKEVTANVTVGQKKTRTAGRGGRGGPGRGNFDPKVFFDRMDADKDGKLSGDEIPQWMRPRVDQIDTDKDGAISFEEFQNGRNRGRPGGRGGRGGRGGPGRGGPGGPGGPGGRPPRPGGPGGPGGGPGGRPARPGGPDS